MGEGAVGAWGKCDTGGVTHSFPSAGPLRAVTLLTRGGCGGCVRALRVLEGLRAQVPFALSVVDVDLAADQEADAGGEAPVAGFDGPGLRAEFGDRLPVVLLDGEEHSYWDVDVDGLRAELGR